MNFEITGRLVEKYDTQVISDKFKKREFVIEISEQVNGSTYTNFAKIQLVQNKCDLLDRFNPGDVVKVNFSIRGNVWEKEGKKNYITNLDAWRIESATAAPEGTSYQPQAATTPSTAGMMNTAAPADFVPSSGNADDLPF